jgi:hypothetical protein
MMNTYSILFAEDVPHYGVVHLEAENDAAALEAAKAYDLSDITNDAEWENSVCKRIVHIEDPNGKTVSYDVPLDDYVLRSGGERERLLCDAASAMLDALRFARKCFPTLPGSMMARLPSAPSLWPEPRLPKQWEAKYDRPP